MQILLALERLYMNFFMRDLAYLFGGSIAIASFYYPFDGCLANSIADQSWETVVVFLACAYVLGLLASEAVLLICRACHTRIKKDGSSELHRKLFHWASCVIRGEGVPDKFLHAKHVALMRRIDMFEKTDRTLLRIERLTYVKSAMGALSGCIAAAGVVLLVRKEWAEGMVFLALFLVIVTDYIRIINDEYKTKMELAGREDSSS